VGLLSRRRATVRPITEEIAYSRCHGDRGADLVRITKLEPKRPRHDVLRTGELLRRSFEARLDGRSRN
jgi:hypothetical protein